MTAGAQPLHASQSGVTWATLMSSGLRTLTAFGTFVVVALLVSPTPVGTQGQGQKPVLYVVATSHLDSQWNWTVQDSIRRFVPATFFENYDRFERFPNYVFSYEGAIHYMWFKECLAELLSRAHGIARRHRSQSSLHGRRAALRPERP